MPASDHFEVAAQAIDLARIVFQRSHDKQWPKALESLTLVEVTARAEILHILAQQCQVVIKGDTWIPLALSIQQRYRAIVRKEGGLPHAMVLFAECHADYWEATIAMHLAALSESPKNIALYQLASQACADAALAMEERPKVTNDIFEAGFSNMLSTLGLSAVDKHLQAKNAWLRDQLIVGGEEEEVINGAPMDLFAPFKPARYEGFTNMRLVETIEGRSQSFLKEVGGAENLELLLVTEEGTERAQTSVTDPEALALLVDVPNDVKLSRREYAVALRAKLVNDERWMAYLVTFNDTLVTENDRTLVTEKLKLSLDLIRTCVVEGKK